MQTAPFSRTTLRMCSGIIAWALHFAAVYGFTALACAFGLRATFGLSVTAVVVVLTAIALAATLAFVAGAMRAGLGAFENAMTAGLGALAALAIVWEGLVPVFMLPPCV
jgi:hypothetical protein